MLPPSLSAEAHSPESIPVVEYERRRTVRQAEVHRYERWEKVARYGRILTFLSIVLFLYGVLDARQSFLPWLFVAVAAFGGAVFWHRRVVRSGSQSRRAVRYYARAVDRLHDQWAGNGPSGERYLHADHPYAADLDLFGHGSLFQLLCAARTQMGRDTLAAMLLHGAAPETIRARQTAIQELRDGLDVRERLAVLEAPTVTGLHPQSLHDWTDRPALLTDWGRPLLAAALASISIAALVGWAYFGMHIGWFVLAAALQGLLLQRLRQPMRAVTHSIDMVLSELKLLLQVLRIMEAQQYSSPLLCELLGRLHSDGIRPSQRVARLARLADAWDSVRRNQFIAPFAFVMMLPVYLAYAIERWRLSHGRAIADWLMTVGEFEALCCFAGYAFEHPQYPFPEILENERRLDSLGLGHPLIPAWRRVTNDVDIGMAPQLLLVTGSNMSGKSTLLRTVGINAAMALAGAPVCAARMRISPLTIATAMRKVDSLHEGVSAFYAEIQRLRTISELASLSPPVLFLLDEILHGTNSHDRRIGAEAVIESLLKQGATGFVTTHDLLLAEIVPRLGSQAANVHFEDQLTEGKITFDYRLRPDVVPKGNGLVLMRLLGFDT